jgi:hypothetical protein
MSRGWNVEARHRGRPACGAASPVVAQEPDPTTREAAIEQEQAEKAKVLHPYVPGKVEGCSTERGHPGPTGVPRWHPYFESAYYGGGFTLGAGYAHHVSPYNMLDVRGSYTILGYKRIEAEFTPLVCSIAVAPCRSSVAGARRRKRPSMALGWARRKAIARTSTFDSRTGRAP